MFMHVKPESSHQLMSFFCARAIYVTILTVLYFMFTITVAIFISELKS